MNHYYVFCKNLIAVQTSIKNFKWVFGRNAPNMEKEAFDQCLIKLNIETDDDTNISDQCDKSSQRFGDYYGRFGDNQIIFNKNIKAFGNLSYKISVNDNSLRAVIGKRYLKFIKFKIMHLHPMYYILFDFATALLLENGYTPIYSSAVKLPNDKTVIMLAPPNTGKSLTSLKLVNEFNAALIAEDVAITDGARVWPVPYTNSYRNYGKLSYNGSKKFCSDSEKIDFLFWLMNGEEAIKTFTLDAGYKIQLLNDYLLYYAKSPAIDAFNYFNQRFVNTNLIEAERKIMNNLLLNVTAKSVFETDAMKYAQAIFSEAK